MADYKDIISGTFKNIAGKVKEVAESGSVRSIYEQGSERAKSYANIAKLTLELNGDTEELKRVYTEIGKLYFEENRDKPEGFFTALFAQVEEINARIHEKEDIISELRSSTDASKQPDIDVEVGEFEEIVDSTEADGAGKGED